MQIDRLLQIVQILLHKEKVTARELAQKFDVSTRTIYRDVDTLSLNGVPIYATKGKGGGIQLMENYTMDRSVLSEEEKNSILLGLETLHATQAENVDEALQKFSALFRQDQHNWIRVDFSHWGNDPQEKQKFEDIKKALTTYHAITFDYYDAYGNHTSRDVYPIQLVFKEKAWYLIGHCKTREAFRFFKLMRMAKVRVSDRTFNPSQYPLTKDLLAETTPLIGERYLFRISKHVRYRIFDDFFREQIQLLPDGDFEVTYYGQVDEWLYGFIFSYGEHLEVLEPESLRQTMAKKAEMMVANYRK